MNFFKRTGSLFLCLFFLLTLLIPFGNKANGALTDTPYPFGSFAFFDILVNGQPFVDYEGQSDPTANTGVGDDSVDISSGCTDEGNVSLCPETNCNPNLNVGLDTCGTETSGFWAHYDGATTWDGTDCSSSMCDDSLAFRVRLNGDPASSNGIDLRNDHYLVIMDIDGDGFSDFLVDVDGNFSGSPNASDRVSLFYNVNNNSQDCTQVGHTCTQGCIDTTTNCTQSDIFHACNTITSDGSDCDNSHTEARAVNDGTGEFYLDIQLPLCSFTDENGNKLFNPDTVAFGVALSTSNGNSDPFQKDAVPDCILNEESCDFSDTVPVTLSSFRAERDSGGVRFDWSTATETGNAGFNIYADTPEGKRLVNESIIPSKAVDSLSPLDYSYKSLSNEGEAYYISDVDLNGNEKLHGPFALGKSYGQKAKAEKIDWEKINTEVSAKKALSIKSKKLKALSKTASLKSKSSKLTETSAVTLQSQYPRASIKVKEDGIYRVSYQDLADIGLDLGGVDINSLALTHKGIPQAIYISSTDQLFGAGDYIEFVGQGINTLYTDTNVYILEVNSSAATRVSINSKSIKPNAAFEQSYTEKLNIGENNSYTFSSPGSDPWIDARLFARPTSPVSKVYSFNLDNLATSSGGNLKGILWGLTDFPQNPDHHVNIKLNGAQVEDEIFNGLTLIEVNAELDSLGVTLQESSNQLEVNLPADTGVAFDIIDVDSFTVSFERNFIANNGKLVYSDKGEAFEVQNLTSSDLVVYSKDGSSVSKHTNLQITDNGGTFSVKFAGDKNNSINYYVFEQGSVLSPELEITPDTQSLKTGQAQYLIISHPSFINDLGTLIAEREKQFSVKLTDVEAVYTEFNGGIFDPQAIRNYVEFAVNNLGTQHVLLVGGDSYDYHDFIGNSSFSFIPTFYAKVQQFANFAPSDALIADIDGDSVQDVSIGRFPVRTSGELSNIIEKTLTYSLTKNRNAVFAADANDGHISFSDHSDTLIDQLPVGWTVDKAYIEGSTVAEAKSILIDSINSGRALTSFFGHSSFGIWTFSGLFNLTDAQNLTNDGHPTVVTQYGCWNTYFVDPTLNTLGHKFLLSGSNGAAAVTGPTSLSDPLSDKVIGNILLKNLFSGQSIGEAIRDAKQQMAASGQKRLDVIIGWNLLGDPALVVLE